MRFRQTIAAKIFGLAIILLLLTIALACFLLYEVTRTTEDLTVVANFDVPLTQTLARLDEFGLRRRLAFERWFGALNAAEPNREIVAEATENYTLFTRKLTDEFSATRHIIKAYPENAPGSHTLAEVETLLDQIEPAYQIVNNRQREVLDLQLAGQHDMANARLNLLNDLQGTIQDQRALVKSKMAAWSSSATKSTEERERRVFWLTIAATTSTVLLGLAVAALVSNRLSRPMRSLASAMRDVQGGNLNIQLPVNSTDEVGRLTDSFNFFVQELRSKERMKQTFGKYIDPRILEQVLAESGEAAVASGRREMTVLFADLVGFTGLSERLTGLVMVTLLNRHFGLQALAVQEHKGVVDKFVGDSIVAFWGSPFVKTDEHAMLACRAAQAQLTALDTLRRELPDITGLRRDAPHIDLCIGICTGEVVVGNIGSENTRSYTVVGDSVNLAARLETANRVYGTQILINETTAQAIASQFEMREVDTISVKGKTETTRIFELMSAAGQLSEESVRLHERYDIARKSYLAQDWDTAEKAFRECLQIRPNDGPSRVLLQRIQFLRRNPPGKDWNGVWHLREK
ncbi:MAG TPA: adenylate/guanylate cyclase domain-containing protein [Candidatus Udaeobacter sp.]|nr:adenylate/guanylate cyclase domain-containing protein [Candidatus Udaeobacter sp.]